ncbi:hypothetical protein DL240_04500 [Lujinxingia litoralis]|uniref:Double Cache domain-containing protein n=1 Tax=Lujinxingia litoralis TaxID=2211119 RepID=A0A328CA12_9DELT|nr:hypothetical protein [Lujinxingia litoralis]RAL25477.1 hypothetical protein DL240_04500 [Lujinxingia litoralis]
MFRFQIVLGFVVAVALFTATAYLIVENTLGPALLEDGDIALQRTALIAEKSRRLDEYALLEKARFVASRHDLQAAMSAEYPGDAEYERHVEVHKLLERDQIRFTEFIAPRNQGLRNIDLPLDERRPANHEIFMAVDRSGRGVATMGDNLAHWMGENVARDFPLVRDVMESGEPQLSTWNWSWSATDLRQLYVVAIAPLRAPGSDTSVGAVILGNLVNDGVAARSQGLFAGDTSETYQPRGDSREAALVPEIAFFQNERIYGSTLSTNAQRALARQLFEESRVTDSSDAERFLNLSINQVPYRALVRFFHKNQDERAPSGMVLLANVENTIAPVERASALILRVGLAVMVFGALILLVLLHLYTRRFSQIEQGIQEVISGNRDYEFSTQGYHDDAASLAHYLNVMNAALQGKSMPDEDVNAGDWPDLKRGGSQPSIHGVPLMMGASSSSADASPDNDTNSATTEDVPS